MSEKLDGVRAYWDGRQLVSRQGYAFTTPKGFTAQFPSQYARTPSSFSLIAQPVMSWSLYSCASIKSAAPADAGMKTAVKIGMMPLIVFLII